MIIIEELLKKINTNCRSIKKVNIGLYTAYVENSEAAGLSSTLYFSGNENDKSHRHFNIENAGELHNLKPNELCRLVYSNTVLEASVGMAAINSFINADLNVNKCCSINAFELIAEKGADKTIGIIGHYPFIEKLKKRAKKLYIFDNSPKDDDDLSSSEIEKYLPFCDVVAITGTSLINHTIDYIQHNFISVFFNILLNIINCMIYQ